MKRAWCLSFLAVIAAGAITTATAAAVEPVFQRVVTTPVKEGEKIPFKSTGAKTTLETVEKAKIACTSTTNTGSITGPTSLTLAITFKGCESSATKCTSAGAAEGEIVTNVFEGKLGNLKNGSTPGIALFQSKTSTVDAEFTCGTTKVKLTGGVVGQVTNVGKPSTKLIISYVAKSGVQLFESLFGGTLDVLNLQFAEGKAMQSAVVTKDTLVFPEAIQVS
jgi:hypothetical protein